MRREKILKICLNHALTKDVEYSKKDEKTWMFSAPDFSEGEISYDQFCLRFKTVEIAADFKKAINNALGDTSGKIKVQIIDSQVFIYGSCIALAALSGFLIYKKLK